jgi:hypothetical protein
MLRRVCPVTIVVVGMVGGLECAQVALAGAALASPGASPSAIWLANRNSNAITEYAPGANGSPAPINTIAGPATGLDAPTGVAFGPNGDVLVVNSVGNSITVYAPGASGNVAPTATIAGASTGLSGPGALRVDTAGDIYVSNESGTPSVTEYAPSATGDAAPIATISGSGTGLDFDRAGSVSLAVGAGGDVLVADSAGNEVTAYPPGSTGNVAPVVAILGASTGLGLPDGVAADPAGNLFVANEGGRTVTEYAPGATGDVAPIRKIAGTTTGLDLPTDLDVDAADDVLVANAATNTVTEFAPGSNGDVAPTATISGPDIANPEGLIPDPEIVADPASQTVPSGTTATFTAEALGSPAPSVQWQVSTDGGLTFTNVPGATATTLTLTNPTTALSGDLYQAVFRSGSAVATSTLARLIIGRVVIGAPQNTALPLVTGTPTVGDKLACSSGGWSNSPTGYAYQWGRNGTPIAGATGSTYTVQTIDEGSTLTCTVTASNAVGKTAATSAAVSVSVPPVSRCPKASGRLSGTTLGLIHLGMTRAQAKRAYKHSSDRSTQNQDFFCLTPIGIRTGYPSAKLAKTLSRSERKKVQGRVIWASTSNPYFALDGVRAGAKISAPHKKLRTGKPFRIGANTWYLAPYGSATAVLKVRKGIVEEVGIANKQLTKTRTAQRALLGSFD